MDTDRYLKGLVQLGDFHSMKKPAPIEQICTLYFEKQWPVTRIAGHLRVSKQAVYERMRREGISYRSRKIETVSDISESTLEKLYLVEKLTIAEIARRLDLTWGRVARALNQYGIDRRNNRTFKITQGLDRIGIGESLEVETDGDAPFRIYSEARRLGIRVTIRRLSEKRFAIIRIPRLRADVRR